MNKVKFGLKNVHWAKATIASDGTATYGATHPYPGAVNLSLDPEGELAKFFADNIVYHQTNTNAGYSGDFESAIIHDDFREEIMGEVRDANGALIEVSDAPVVPFALMFQFEGDEKATRQVLYNVTASRPSIAGATTEDTTEPQTETLSLSVASVKNAALDKDTVKAKLYYGQTGYDTFFDSVYQAAGTSFVAYPGTVSIAPGGVAVVDYSGTSSTVTASADNSDITVDVYAGRAVITLDSDATEGGTVTFTAGLSTATVDVVLA